MNAAGPIDTFSVMTVPVSTFSPASMLDEIISPAAIFSSFISSMTGVANPALRSFSVAASFVSPTRYGTVAMPSIASSTPLPELIVKRTVPFFSRNAPPTGVCITTLPAEIYSDSILPPIVARRTLFSIEVIASSLYIPSTSGAITILSGITTLLLYLEKFITPVSSRTPKVISAIRSIGISILIHKGHEYISIFLIFPYLRFAGGSAFNSPMNAATSGVLSSIRTFIALRIAFSRFTEIFLFILCGSSRISLFWDSYFALRSIASGGVFPVIILYSVAASAYTSV